MFALTPEAQGHLFVSIILSNCSHLSESAGLFSVPTDLVITNGTRCDAFELASAVEPMLMPYHSSPSASMTGTPILWAPMASVVNASGRQALVDSILETIANGGVTPLEMAQFAVQLAWLTQKNPKVPEVQVIFASLPGTPGLPLPDGSLGVWMPSSHVVSPQTLYGCPRLHA